MLKSHNKNYCCFHFISFNLNYIRKNYYVSKMWILHVMMVSVCVVFECFPIFCLSCSSVHNYSIVMAVTHVHIA